MPSIKVVVSLVTVPVKVMVWAPLLETKNGILKMPKLAVAGDTVLPTCVPSIVAIMGLRLDDTLEYARRAALNDSV